MKFIIVMREDRNQMQSTITPLDLIATTHITCILSYGIVYINNK